MAQQRELDHNDIEMTTPESEVPLAAAPEGAEGLPDEVRDGDVGQFEEGGAMEVSFNETTGPDGRPSDTK